MSAPPHLPWPDNARYLQTGDLLVDLRYRRALCAGTEVELPQRIFDLLLLLLAEPHKLHTRTALFQRLWPGVIVEDANLSQSVWLLRKALGDERKHWVRTVAKAGYVFEPPGTVQWFSELPSAAHADMPAPTIVPDTTVTAADVTPSTAPPASPAPRSASRRHWFGWAAAMGAFAAMAIGLVWLRGEKQEVAPELPQQPLTVALIEVEDPAAASRWPVKLLRQWLAWKLDSLPEVTLLTEAELAADTSATAPKVVFLSSSSAPDDPGQVLLRARFQEPAAEQRIEVRGALADVPAMADNLSRQVMQRLAPGRASPWPVLALDARAARRYADAVDAGERRDWMAAAAISEEVVKLAPRFGLARLQLARAQSRLAQAPSAIEQMNAARDLLQPAPAEVKELLEAQRLAVDPQRTQEAAEAYAKLATRYPTKSSFTLELAGLRSATGQPQDALKILTARNWERESMGRRIARLLLLADVHMGMGETTRAYENAKAAERMARAAGGGWELEHATALLQLAQTESVLHPERSATTLYDEATKLLDSAGNHTAALYAQFLAETARPPVPGANPRMDTLLAKAHAGGYRGLELEILLRVAFQHHSVGDLASYRTRLLQALAVAETAGDVLQRNHLELLVLNEDVLLARLQSADARVQRLRRAGLQGGAALMVDQFDATQHLLRGRYQHAVRILDTAERQLNALPPGTTTEARAALACTRVEARLALGELAGARTDLATCATSREPNPQLLAVLGRANTELLAGDRAEARSLLQRVPESLAPMPDGPDRWIDTLQLAALLTRAGDAAGSDRLYAELLPKLRPSGYTLLIAMAETGLAENAAARGDWARSKQYAATARQALPEGTWPLLYRLDVIDIQTVWNSGDRDRAIALASQVHAKAHRLGDAVAQMEIHSLLPADLLRDTGGLAGRERLVARTGMRGATLDWLTAGAGHEPEITGKTDRR